MRYILVGSIFVAFSILFYSCFESDLKKGERLAKIYCASCHLFPEPSLLDKKSWRNGVMPKMAFRMGMDYSMMGELAKGDQAVVMSTIPDSPMLSPIEWELINAFYQFEAPDSLLISNVVKEDLFQFEPKVWKQQGKNIPQITFSKADTINKRIWLADRASNLYKMGFDFQMMDSIKLSSPASSILFNENGHHEVLLMGIMDPNDQAKGSLNEIMDGAIIKKIDSLKRPVHVEKADLNKDRLTDYVVCSFGNYTGELVVYENMGMDNFKKHRISSLPGARKVIIKDMDSDGLDDIIALITQGDEQITLFSNAGNFRFRVTTLLRFPPSFGSSFFEMADYDLDGKLDILYSNGDNADYSPILKPYHGLRIFTNKGHKQYIESWSFPMPGASQTISRDFDFDGDLDIAAISFFPDLIKHPEDGFIYFENENKGLSFKPFNTALAATGRWMTMDSFDIDDDGDHDLLLAALDFDKGVPPKLGVQWRTDKTSLLVLINKANKKQ